MTTIHADEIRPGDVVHDGRDHRITHVDRQAGWAWPIAADDTGWAMALGHQAIEVRRTGGGPESAGRLRLMRRHAEQL